MLALKDSVLVFWGLQHWRSSKSWIQGQNSRCYNVLKNAAVFVVAQSVNKVPNLGHCSPSSRPHKLVFKWNFSGAKLLKGFLLLLLASAPCPKLSSIISFVLHRVSPKRWQWPWMAERSHWCWAACSHNSWGTKNKHPQLNPALTLSLCHWPLTFLDCMPPVKTYESKQ